MQNRNTFQAQSPQVGALCFLCVSQGIWALSLKGYIFPTLLEII